MALEALDALPASHVPYEYKLIAASGNKGISGFAGSKIYGHDAVRVSVEVLKQLSTLDIPQGTGAVATTRQHLLVAVRKGAAGRVRGVGAHSFFLR